MKWGSGENSVSISQEGQYIKELINDYKNIR